VAAYAILQQQGRCLIPAKESQASVRWPDNCLYALRREGKATASPGREVKASRIAGCPEPA